MVSMLMMARILVVHAKSWGTRGTAWWGVVAAVAVAEMEMMVSGDGGGQSGELLSVVVILTHAEPC